MCYLDQISLIPPVTPGLTLGPSISCSLFRAPKKVNSFAIKHIQPLLAKHPGWGCHRSPVSSSPSLRLSEIFGQSVFFFFSTSEPNHSQPANVRCCSLALCFHVLANCFFRKPFVFTTIQFALGWHPPTAQTRVKVGLTNGRILALAMARIASRISQ